MDPSASYPRIFCIFYHEIKKMRNSKWIINIKQEQKTCRIKDEKIMITSQTWCPDRTAWGYPPTAAESNGIICLVCFLTTNPLIHKETLAVPCNHEIIPYEPNQESNQTIQTRCRLTHLFILAHADSQVYELQEVQLSPCHGVAW